MAQARMMERMTVEEVRQALSETQTVVLPTGGCEQHGYHLPLDTDCHNAVEIARRASERTGCLVAPCLAYSFSGGGLPGTVDISPQLSSLLIKELLEALARQGLRNLVVVLGHGGSENDQLSQYAADLFLRANPQFADRRVALFRWWQEAPSAQRAFADHDYHAGYLETSLMLYWRPELVRPREKWVTDEEELARRLREEQDAYQTHLRAVDDPAVVARIVQNPATKVGVAGDPSCSSEEFGRQVCEEAVGRLVELIRKLEASG